MIEAFLICALSLPAKHHTRPAIVAWQMSSEESQLRDWLHKNNPDAEIFIHPKPKRDILKEHGYEKVPFTWRGNEIWIQRKPKPGQKMQSRIETSA